MARICEQCGRGALKANSRSHSNIASLRHQQINLQMKTVNGKRMKICTNCIRSSAKTRSSK
ncbi:50S ribosomal protein L28 [Candidatus Uhrbacteria bacterium]|nr:50S ribosomal protein L28 [Candidatus Uhrbacteria bacterium]